MFEYLSVFGTNAWIYGGAFILVLSVLVFVHEWGHYIVARMNGVHVEQFSIGFGPEIFGFDDQHGTRWKFSWIPLGGYVKMYGDVDPASAGHEDAETIPANRKLEAFFAKPVHQRAAIVFAGPAINYLYALIVMAIVFAFYGQPVTPPQAGAIIGDSAAAEAGFQPHDTVLAIDGKPIESFEDIRRAMLIHLDTPREFLIDRNGQALTLQATPKKQEQTDRFGFKSSRGLLGMTSVQHAIPLDKIGKINGEPVTEAESQATLTAMMGQQMRIDMIAPEGVEEPPAFYFVRPLPQDNPTLAEDGVLILTQDGAGEITLDYTPLQAFAVASAELWHVTEGTLQALGQMITGTRSPQELGGLIRIGAIAGDVAQQGWIALLMFSALLSINLGLINLFPIPVLDGGHLVFYALEVIRGRPVPEKAQEYAFRVGFGMLIMVMLFANVNDVIQILT